MIKVHLFDGTQIKETEVGTYPKAEAWVVHNIGTDATAFAWIEANKLHYTMLPGQTTRGEVNLMAKDSWPRYAKAFQPVEEVPVDNQPTATVETIVVEHVAAAKPGEILARSEAQVNLIKFTYTDVNGQVSVREGIVAKNPPPFVNKVTGEKHHLLHIYATLRPEDPRSKGTPMAFRHFEASRMTDIVEVGPLTPAHPAYALFTRIQPQAKVLAARVEKK